MLISGCMYTCVGEKDRDEDNNNSFPGIWLSE